MIVALEHLQAFLTSVEPPEKMSPETLAALLDIEKTLTEWFKSVREVSKARVAAKEITIPGYAIGPGRRAREWKDEGTAVAAMSAAGINDPYRPRQLKSVPEAEKEVAEERKALLETGWTWIAGTPTLKKSKNAEPGAPIFGDESNTFTIV